MTAAETTLAGVATDTNLTNLTNRVTAVEGVNTTQSTNITNATNSISTINTTLTGYTTSITTGALTTSAASTSTPVGVTITQSTNANSKRAAIQLGSGWVVGQDSSTSTSGGVKDFFIYDVTASAYRLKIGTDGIISTISSLKLRPGTATAGTAPLYFDTVSPVLLTSPVAGAMEYDGTNLYFTPSGVARKTVAYLDSSITGNATTATTLATARAINTVNFDGSGPITIKASTTNTLGLTDSNLAFSTGTTWDGGTSGITLGLSATPTGITSINTVTMPTSGSFITSATTSLPSVNTVNGTTIPNNGGTLLTTSSTFSILTSLGTLTKLIVGASAGTNPPIKLTTGTLVSPQNTSAINGSFEYDGQVAYFSPVSTVHGRALLSTPFYYVNSTTRTLSATTTVAQAIFGPDSGTGVGLTLNSFSSYEFEIVGSILATTTVSTNVTLKLTHASYTLMAYHGTYGINQFSPTIIQKQSTTGGADLDLTIGSINTTTARLVFSIKGIIRTNTSRELFMPYVVLNAASSGTQSLVVGPGSYIKITPLGDNNVTGIGYWQ